MSSRENRQYRVVWEIDAECSSPLEAAMDAWEAMHRMYTSASVFEVTDKATGVTVTVDLDDPVSRTKAEGWTPRKIAAAKQLIDAAESLGEPCADHGGPDYREEREG